MKFVSFKIFSSILVIVLSCSSIYANETEKSSYSTKAFLNICVSSRGNPELVNNQAKNMGFIQMPDEYAVHFLKDYNGHAWMINSSEGKFVITQLDNGVCSVFINKGNSDEIQKNLESWLPPKSTGLTYKKEISKDKNLTTTNYIISKNEKPLETWIYTSSSEKDSSLVAVISHQMN
ncbi:NMCC_0638 family (lipo)protein [Acinetobacter lactucae]|uniref:NMCC_0638 family (lipo)protein n=1 Tax=Acinetobacter lactucae TaxID=1785128 RepID=UPI0026C53FB1